jgi:putative FmdB family regulatory protein
MPLYEYQCGNCGKMFEILRRIKDADSDVECPDGRSKKVERMLSRFAAGAYGSFSSGGFT